MSASNSKTHFLPDFLALGLKWSRDGSSYTSLCFANLCTLNFGPCIKKDANMLYNGSDGYVTDLSEPLLLMSIHLHMRMFYIMYNKKLSNVNTSKV